MPLNLNNAPEQRPDGLIPDGTFVKLRMTIIPGGLTVPNMDPIDNELFKQSETSDVASLDCEFIVLSGPYRLRKIWQKFTVAGGKLDNNDVSIGWNITFGQLKAMLDSAIGLDPDDKSPGAQAKRVLRGIRDFDQIEFVAKLGIEAGKDAPGGGKYADKNRIEHVVTPNKDEWKIVMGGGEAPAKPSGGGSAGPARQEHGGTPSWQAQAAPAAAPPAQATMPLGTAAPQPAPVQVAGALASYLAGAPLTPAAPAAPAEPVAGPNWLRG